MEMWAMGRKEKPEDFENVISQMFGQIWAQKDNPRASAILAHGFLELLVNVLVEATCKHGKRIAENRDYSHAMKIVLLHERGVISDFNFTVLDKFRSIRND